MLPNFLAATHWPRASIRPPAFRCERRASELRRCWYSAPENIYGGPGPQPFDTFADRKRFHRQQRLQASRRSGSQVDKTPRGDHRGQRKEGGNYQGTDRIINSPARRSPVLKLCWASIAKAIRLAVLPYLNHHG